MNIYIDYDDCLCETARNFSMLVKQMYDKNIPYEKIDFFDLICTQNSGHIFMN